MLLQEKHGVVARLCRQSFVARGFEIIGHERYERVLVFDGAMGTQIQGFDLKASDFGGKEGANDLLTLTRPDLAAASMVLPSGATVAPFAGTFTYTSPRGMRMHPVLHRLKMHDGIDLVAVPRPGPILAVQAGKVIQAAPAGSAGRCAA